jgi:hypothetical protein
MQSIPHHGNNEEGGSLQYLKVGHKCNGSPHELTDGGGPTRCTTQRRKYYKVHGKVESLGKQKTKHSPLGLRKTSNVHGVNQKPCMNFKWRLKFLLFKLQR